MSEVSTAGHGPSRGYGGMNDHLKRYFRAQGNPQQQRMDAAFTRTGPLGKVNHTPALRRGTRRYQGRFSPEAIREMRRRHAGGGESQAELAKYYGISRSWLSAILAGTARKSVK